MFTGSFRQDCIMNGVRHIQLHYGIILSVESEGGADLVGRAGRGNVVQPLSI
jgi:hypothetical protein